MRSINRIPLALLLVVCCLSAHADDGRGGELGVVVGAIAPDDEMTGNASSAELTLGLRGGSVFTEQCVDLSFTHVETDIVEGFHAGERLAHPLQLKQRYRLGGSDLRLSGHQVLLMLVLRGGPHLFRP